MSIKKERKIFNHFIIDSPFPTDSPILIYVFPPRKNQGRKRGDPLVSAIHQFLSPISAKPLPSSSAVRPPRSVPRPSSEPVAQKTSFSHQRRDGGGKKFRNGAGSPRPGGAKPPPPARRRPGPCRWTEKDRKGPAGRGARRPTFPLPGPDCGCFGDCRDGAGERGGHSTAGAECENSDRFLPR